MDRWLLETADYHLSCIYSVIAAWVRAGKPETKDARHDFVDWAQPLDWIVRNYFGLPPLLDGLREQLDRISSKAQTTLRDILQAIRSQNEIIHSIPASRILECCIREGVTLCGLGADYVHEGEKADPRLLEIGKILGPIFKEARARAFTWGADADPEKGRGIFKEMRVARIEDWQILRLTFEKRIKDADGRSRPRNGLFYEFWPDDIRRNPDGTVPDLWETYNGLSDEEIEDEKA